MPKKCIVLTSGGVDSTTCLAIATKEKYECYTLSFDYGQKHRYELKAAKQLAKLYDAKHTTFHLPIGQFGGSALTDALLEVPDYTGSDAIPITYVPARNTIFLSIALALAEVVRAYDIFTGVSAVDYSHYPDCRPEYIRRYQSMANLATKDGIEGKLTTIHTPLIHLSKAETIKLGLSLGVDYSQTVSCYRADDYGRACGSCDSCTLRRKGFRELGIADPTRYLEKSEALI
jgi:7-cyano-7-deazaguanine synthase